MQPRRGLSKREAQRLIRPVFIDLIQMVRRETSVLAERSRILVDLSRELRGGREKTESKVDPQELKEWVKPAIAYIDGIAREKTQEIKDELKKEIDRTKVAEQLTFALCFKLLFTCGKITARKWTIALGVAAGVIAVAIAIAAVLKNGETGEEARRRISEEDSP